MQPWLTVVGIGEDGFKGLGKHARRALLGASRIIGGQRQLDLLPVCIRGERQLWPSPFSLAPVLEHAGEAVCVLASGETLGGSGDRIGLISTDRAAIQLDPANPAIQRLDNTQQPRASRGA